MATIKREIQCLCDETFSVEIEPEIDLSAHPSIVDQILEGNFQSYLCPGCKNFVKVEEKTLFKHEAWKKGLEFRPETDRGNYLSQGSNAPANVDRIVFGYKELAEKVQIDRDGLNDQAIEILKYLFLQKERASDDVSLLYRGLAEDKIEFYVEGLREKEVGITGVRLDFYEKIAHSLPQVEEPLKTLVQPPYVNVKAFHRE